MPGRSMQMTDITIPPAALEAGARAMAKAGYDFAAIEIIDPYTADADYWNYTTRAAFVAMVEALPGMHVHETQRSWLGGFSERKLMLPIPQEASDDQ